MVINGQRLKRRSCAGLRFGTRLGDCAGKQVALIFGECGEGHDWGLVLLAKNHRTGLDLFKQLLLAICDPRLNLRFIL